MSLKTYKPYTKSTRSTILIDRKSIWKAVRKAHQHCPETLSEASPDYPEIKYKPPRYV